MLRVQLPDFGQLPANAAKRLAQQRELLTALGKLLLARVQADYDVKADHGEGSDGEGWDDLTPSYVEARVLRRAPARRLLDQIKLLEKQDYPSLRNSDARRAQIRQAIAQIRNRIKAIINEELRNYKIGIDTGMQRAAQARGLEDTVWNRPEEDGLGLNLFEVTDTSVTLGYEREYSSDFDERRPLIPEPLPKAWLSELDRTAGKWGGRVIQDAINAFEGL
jgi:hypothetical protein